MEVQVGISSLVWQGNEGWTLDRSFEKQGYLFSLEGGVLQEGKALGSPKLSLFDLQILRVEKEAWHRAGQQLTYSKRQRMDA